MTVQPEPGAEAEAAASLTDPYARKVAIDASVLEARAVDAERAGMLTLARTLRQRVEKMVRRAGSSEAKARAIEAHNRETNRDPNVGSA